MTRTSGFLRSRWLAKSLWRGGLVLTVLLLALWIASAFWWVGWWKDTPGGVDQIHLGEGGLVAARLIGVMTHPDFHWAAGDETDTFKLWFDWAFYPPAFMIRIPLWFPTAIVGVAAFFAKRLDAIGRRGRLGLCRKCGYDLAGITSRACPECGTGRTGS